MYLLALTVLATAARAEGGDRLPPQPPHPAVAQSMAVVAFGRGGYPIGSGCALRIRGIFRAVHEEAVRRWQRMHDSLREAVEELDRVA
jgi:hypothetical protein